MLSTTNMKESPHLMAECEKLFLNSFPKFVNNPNLIPNPYGIGDLDHIVVFRKQEKIVALGAAVPFDWSGNVKDLPTFDHLLRSGIKIQSGNQVFNSLVGFAICVAPDERGKGLAGRVISEMKSYARQKGCKHFLIPARPSGKHLYPLQSLAEYSKWRRRDGKLVDNWLRVHENMGAKFLYAMESCDVYSGPLKEWTDSTGLMFPTSGSYVVQGALSPLQVDVEEGIGTVSEGNFWVEHAMDRI